MEKTAEALKTEADLTIKSPPIRDANILHTPHTPHTPQAALHKDFYNRASTSKFLTPMTPSTKEVQSSGVITPPFASPIGEKKVIFY